MNETNYRPNGVGDTKKIPEGSSTDCGYSYDKSLAGTGESDLMKGYCDKEGISGATKSDKGFA